MTFFWITLIKIGITLFWVMNLGSLLTWVERKQSAVMQDRIGANRANIGPFRMIGLFQIAADSLKMILKEDWIPPGGNKFLHTIAPMISVFFALMAFAVIPIGDSITIGGQQIPLSIVSTDVAILFVFAMLSLEIYGVVFAGYSSNNNYALLGGLRASAQMFSYEITFGATVIGLLMIFGTLNLQEIVRAQKGFIGGFYPRWGFFVQPLGFLLFCAAGLAETKRNPFDLPEGESEIVGYFVEYSGMKFGLFLLTDFLETILISAMVTLLFFGGWQVPFLNADGFHFGSKLIALSSTWVTILQILMFFFKMTVFLWLFMLIRWSLPRFRYDQLMRLGWNILLPLSLLNIFLTGLILMIWKMMPKELKVKVMKGKIKERTYAERAYLPEIAKGLRITAAHFWQNLSVHIRRLFGIRTKEKGSVTFQYPEERRPLSPRVRSLHRLTKREDGSPRCVACMMCETICPAKCIYIIGVDHPDPNIEKRPAKFDIDLGVCVFCGLCVEACPEDAIRMDTGILEISAYSREGMIYNMKDLLR